MRIEKRVLVADVDEYKLCDTCHLECFPMACSFFVVNRQRGKEKRNVSPFAEFQICFTHSCQGPVEIPDQMPAPAVPFLVRKRGNPMEQLFMRLEMLYNKRHKKMVQQEA